MELESKTPTPYGVYCVETFDVGKPPCNSGRIIFLTEQAYDAQMSMPDALWKCPRCRGEARWSDENFEKYLDAAEEPRVAPGCLGVFLVLILLAASASAQFIAPRPELLQAGIARTRPSRPPSDPTPADYFEVWLYRDGLNEPFHVPMQAVKVIAIASEPASDSQQTVLFLPEIDPSCGGDTRRFYALMQVDFPRRTASGAEAFMRPGKTQLWNFIVLDQNGLAKNSWPYEVQMTRDDLNLWDLLWNVRRRAGGR